MAGHGSFRVLCQKEALLDARITKQRLSNLISYDWIKIVVTIVVACLVLALLFAFTAARPRRAQEFYVYAYTDVSTGSDFSSLKEELEDGVFSYDILSVGTEGFDGSMGSTTYTLRRSVGSGNVLFVTDNRVYETDEEGQIVLDEEGEPVVETESTLYTMASGSVVSKDSSTAGVVYDTKYYLDACERYLAQFFGDDWRTSDVLDGDRTPEESFARNKKDNRFRSDEAYAQGVELEKARLRKLREDLLAVEAAFEERLLSHTCYENALGEEESLGIDVGGLSGLHDLVYYMDGEERAADDIRLVLLFNGALAQDDLRFESISFLRYLVENYNG